MRSTPQLARRFRSDDAGRRKESCGVPAPDDARRLPDPHVLDDEILPTRVLGQFVRDHEFERPRLRSDQDGPKLTLVLRNDVEEPLLSEQKADAYSAPSEPAMHDDLLTGRQLDRVGDGEIGVSTVGRPVEAPAGR